MWSTRAALSISAVLVCACVSSQELGDGIDDDFPIGKGDGAISEGSPEACAALGAANSATREELDDDAGLLSTAADSIIEHRPFADLAALDDAPWIGRIALDHLVAYGESLGLTCSPSPLGDLRLRGSLVLFSGDHQDEYSERRRRLHREPARRKLHAFPRDRAGHRQQRGDRRLRADRERGRARGGAPPHGPGGA